MKKLLFIFLLLFMFVSVSSVNASMIIKTETIDSVWDSTVSDHCIQNTDVDYKFYEVAPFNITDFEAFSWKDSWQEGFSAEVPNFFNIGFSFIASAGYVLEVQNVTETDIPNIVAGDYWVLDSFFLMDSIFWYYNFATKENVTIKRNWVIKSLAVFNPVFESKAGPSPVPLPNTFCLFTGSLVALVAVRKVQD